MISEALSAMKGASFFPIIGMILFGAAFIGIVVWVVRLRKPDVQRFARIPLDEPASEGEINHG